MGPPSDIEECGTASPHPPHVMRRRGGFEGATGFSPRQGERALALAASFPAGLVMEQRNLRFQKVVRSGGGGTTLGLTMNWSGSPSRR